MNKQPYKGVPYQPCHKCGRMARTYNYCDACAKKIHEEWLLKEKALQEFLRKKARP